MGKYMSKSRLLQERELIKAKINPDYALAQLPYSETIDFTAL